MLPYNTFSIFHISTIKADFKSSEYPPSIRAVGSEENKNKKKKRKKRKGHWRSLYKSYFFYI